MLFVHQFWRKITILYFYIKLIINAAVFSELRFDKEKSKILRDYEISKKLGVFKSSKTIIHHNLLLHSESKKKI